MRVACYLRISTEEQKHGYSIADQQRATLEHAERMGWRVVEVVKDEGFSGASPDRPGLARVMELAEAGDIDAVLATKRDRLYRSRLYRLMMDQDLEEYGVRLVALNDTNNRLADGFMDEFAAYEREQITQRTNAGKRQKARSGKVVAGPRPVFGYRFTKDKDHYEPYEPELVSVRRLFSLIADGESVSSTARILTREGYPAPRSGKWLRPAIREIVSDDVYYPHTREEVQTFVSPEVAQTLTDETYGVWWYNRREAVKTRRGTKIRPKPRSEWIAVPVPDAGVPRETADSARAVLSRNERRPKSTAAGREWELSGGAFRCAGCGNALVPVASATYHTLKSGERKRYPKYSYRCDTRRRGQECPHPQEVSAPRTEAAIWSLVRSGMLQPRKLESDLRRASRGKRRKPDPGRLAAILARLEELKKRRTGLVELAADGDIPRDELRDRLPPLDGEISALKREVDALHRERSEGLQEDARMVLRRMRETAPEVLDSLDSRGRRLLYRDLGLKVFLNEDKSLSVSWLAMPLGEIRREKYVASAVSSGITPKITALLDRRGVLVFVA